MEQLLQDGVSCKNVWVFFVDIDGLKGINDKFGHIEGDRLLRVVAQLLYANTDAADIVFRYGGDEFVMVFPQKDASYAEKILNRIQHEIEKINKSCMPYPIAISAGRSLCDLTCAGSPLDMIRAADQMMYKEKNHKKTGGLHEDK